MIQTNNTPELTIQTITPTSSPSPKRCRVWACIWTRIGTGTGAWTWASTAIATRTSASASASASISISVLPLHSRLVLILILILVLVLILILALIRIKGSMAIATRSSLWAFTPYTTPSLSSSHRRRRSAAR